jgi:hypothetical protein
VCFGSRKDGNKQYKFFKGGEDFFGQIGRITGSEKFHKRWSKLTNLFYSPIRKCDLQLLSFYSTKSHFRKKYQFTDKVNEIRNR